MTFTWKHIAFSKGNEWKEQNMDMHWVLLETFSKDFSKELRQELALVMPVVKNSPSNAGDIGLISGQGTKMSHTMDN